MPTRRELIQKFLTDGPYPPRELAKLMGLKIVDLIDDLEHLQKSVGKKFTISPAYCESCDFTFTTRQKLSTPSRCPKCRKERIAGPWFQIKE